MSVDYDALREDNLKRYGWDTAVLDLLGQLYSERTHFIFELIQNAEDARATELTFELFEDRLEVRHDGRPFSEDDVRGICGVGKSMKSEDLTQIGKFGIGFKSVYAYTTTPRVHCADEHFRIENYVRPFAADRRDLTPGETLFVFPFDHAEPSAATAVEEISTALNSLELGTLLFLRNIERLRICGLETAEGTLERVAVSRTDMSRHVVLTESFDDDRQGEEWFVWHRQLDDDDEANYRVEIAFCVTTDKGVLRLTVREDSPLVVFFPTEKETFLGFLIQGPYRTTPARDNVPQHDPWNRRLARETSVLLADVLTELRDEGLLTVDVLQAMPLDPSHFQPTSMFRDLFDSARATFIRENLVPLADGGYGKAGQVKLARGAGLRELLSSDQLQALYEGDEPVAFARDSVTENRTPRLWRYLRDELGTDEVTPEAVVARLTPNYLSAQSDKWIGRFYGFLHQNAALLRAPRWNGDPPGAARSKPIIRLEDGSHVTPFDAAGLPRAYLPGPSETEFATVRREVVKNPAARQFLEALEFTLPDVVAEVFDNVLPRYENADVATLDAAQHDADIDRIVRALAEASSERRERLRAQLRQTAFLIGENAATGELQFNVPSSLYIRSPELETYFDGNPEAWFIRDSYRVWFTEFRDLGLRDRIAIRARRRNHLGYVVTIDQHSWHQRGFDGFDPEATMDGLDFALRHPTDARSEYVWNALLAPNRQLLAGVVEESSRQDFSGSRSWDAKSPIGTLATTMSWIPGADGTLHSPAKLELDDLPLSYKRDDVLAKALDMVQPVIEEASRQLGVSSRVLRALSLDPELVARIERELRSRADASAAGAELDTNDDDADPISEGGDYLAALSDAFDRPSHRTRRGTDLDVASASGVVGNPDLRRERVRDAIEEDQEAEPAIYKRFRTVPRRVWEAKDSAVRHFLLEQYLGRCQICDDTFERRDSAPYFEGVYLVSRTRGRWLDRPGNVICLCATCCAKFQHGPVEAPDILEQITTWRTRQEGGDDGASLTLGLCGETVQLRFTEKHLVDLQEIIRAELEFEDADENP